MKRRAHPYVAATFRSERPGDEDAICAVVGDAFSDHEIVPTLVDRLRESPDWIDGLSFVAESDGEIVAHILFTRSPRQRD